MHHIQNSILTNLMTHKTRRFSELRPERVDSNLFQYHLQKLIRDGYVVKLEKGYTLSGPGLYYADRFSSMLRGEQPQPKIIVVNVIQNANAQVLLGRKPRQPFLGSYHLPAGKVHEAEDLAFAARRELFEKAKMKDVQLTYVTLAHITIRQGEVLISEYYATVMHGIHAGNAEPLEGKWCEYNDMPSLCPSVAEILSIPLESPEPFYEWQLQI